MAAQTQERSYENDFDRAKYLSPISRIIGGRTHTQRNDLCAFKIVTRSPTVLTNMKVNETMTKRKSKQINMIRLSSFFPIFFFNF